MVEIPDFDRITKLPAVPRFTGARVAAVVVVELELDVVVVVGVVVLDVVVVVGVVVLDVVVVVGVVVLDVVVVVGVVVAVLVVLATEVGCAIHIHPINSARRTAAETGIKTVRLIFTVYLA
ncbi:MAG: hypothetical protein ABSB29_09040 [Nitrososphaerales archaeon]